jgi:hypothetical protein
MSLSLILQYAIIALLILASLLQVLRKLAPQLSARVLNKLAATLDQAGRTALLRAVGRWLRPKAMSSDCGDGCSACGSCAPARPAAPEIQPIVFHPPTQR